MSWAEIKKAVNSDLSKPLNEQIAELDDLIEEKINAKLDDVFAASYFDSYIDTDDVLMTVPDGSVVSSTPFLILTFTAEVDGDIRIFLHTETAGVQNGNQYIGYAINKTITTMTSATKAITISSTNLITDTTFPLSVKAGDIVRLYISGNNLTSEFIRYSDVKVLGKRKDNSFVIRNIRHIQRGTVNLSLKSATGSTSYQQNVSLAGFSNTNKMVVRVNGSAEAQYSNYGLSDSAAIVTSLSTTQLGIGVAGSYSIVSSARVGICSYEVVEYY